MPDLVHIGTGRGTAAGPERNMAAQDDHLGGLVRYQIQVLFQPFKLLVGVTGIVLPGRSGRIVSHHIVHRNNVDFSAVEGIIQGTEPCYKVLLRIVEDGLRGIVVVVANGLEERQIASVTQAYGRHGGIHRIPLDRVVVGNVAQRHGKEHRMGRIRFLCYGDQGRDGLLIPPAHVRGGLALRIPNHDDREVFLGRIQRFQFEIVPVKITVAETPRSVQLRDAGRASLHGNLVGRRQREIDIPALAVGRHLIHAVGIGNHILVSVRNGNAGNAFPGDRVGNLPGCIAGGQDGRPSDFGRARSGFIGL